ncbi:MAG: 30S ribosomal protein S20 [Actinobacteria bacterium]|nr:30S ribosomal protein S20 [Acidimicrobiia bacterium]MCA1735055.1 30S ribosomal protein S20 [Actinomycetota bacterium]
MANIKSQIKRNRQNVVRQARNKATKSELRTRIKAVRTSVADGIDGTETLEVAQKKLDQAVAKGRLHPRTAARRKSRLSRAVNSSRP